MKHKALVITVSDSVCAGRREDLSGPAVASRLRELGFDVSTNAVPDELEIIAASIRHGLTQEASLIVTTGGTGLAARDVTPEATRKVIEREVPGLAEHMRAAGTAQTPAALLSRGLAGTAAGSLVLNLPGSPAGAVSSLDSVASVIPHVIDLLEGKSDHGGWQETRTQGETSDQ